MIIRVNITGLRNAWLQTTVDERKTFNPKYWLYVYVDNVVVFALVFLFLIDLRLKLKITVCL